MKQTKPTPFELASLAATLSQGTGRPAYTFLTDASVVWCEAVKFLDEGYAVIDQGVWSFSELTRSSCDAKSGDRHPTPSGFTSVNGLVRALKASRSSIDDPGILKIVDEALKCGKISLLNLRRWWRETEPGDQVGGQAKRRVKPTFEIRRPFPLWPEPAKKK